MIDNINAVFDTLLHRIPGASMSTESSAQLVCLLDACGCFLV